MGRDKLKFDTKAVQGVSPLEMSYGGVSTPIYAVSTFAFRDTAQGAALFAKEEQGYIYSRLGNPTNSKLEENVALLEGGEAGLSFSSGMGAINCIVMHYCGAGDRLLTQNTLYGGTHDLFNNQYPDYGIYVDSVNGDDTAAFADKIAPDTKLIFIETPANPTL
ncbi:MAG: methionine gamma-lyase, partial [bacterium]|nr:methionine gamma-lyase [bacterium]